MSAVKGWYPVESGGPNGSRTAIARAVSGLPACREIHSGHPGTAYGAPHLGSHAGALAMI